MKVAETRLLDGLTKVFRQHGYEGASLSRISEATGLQRASLYHRFPGGKEDMAEAVLARVDDKFANHILAPLSEQGEPARRVRKMAQRLREFYSSGGQSCLFDTLSLGGATGVVRQHVKRSFAAWLDAMTNIARESGARSAAARGRAEDAMVRIQGALVVARATGDKRPFELVVAALPGLLTGSGDH